MAALQNILLLAVVCFGFCFASNVFDRIIDGVDSCRETCDKTYSAHTYEHGDQADSCQRGCRFYAIMSFIHNHNDENASMTDCLSSCEEAYGNSTDADGACKLGCNSQRHVPVHKGNPDQEEPSVHVLYPLMYMHGVYSNMIDKVYRHMEVSWSLFMQADNGQLVVVRSAPHAVEFVSNDMEDIPDSLPWMDDKTSAYMETNIASQDNSATPLLNFGASQMRSSQNDDGLRLSSDDVARSDWLTCVARKTGIARIVLCFLILATAIVMIWFCLTAAATAPEQHLSINGDLEYLREKDTFKLLLPQARVEARPLPVKIRVEQI